jgi:hypothetical protein
MTITFKPIQQEYLAAVKTLNSVIFPVKYHVGCGQLGSLAHTPHKLAWVATCAASPAQLLQTTAARLKQLLLCRLQDRTYQDALACGPVSQLGNWVLGSSCSTAVTTSVKHACVPAGQQ